MADDEGQRPPLGSPQEFNSEGDMSQPKPVTDALTGAGVASPGIRVDLYTDPPDERPPLAPHLSAPAAERQYSSPARQHKRTPSYHREIKETLNAKSQQTEDDTDGHTRHVINQYTIKEEIGRGSYGAVHLATDQYGKEYAVKEFSKTRLRKRAQSNILRQGPRGGGGRLPLAPGGGLGFHRSSRMSNHEANEAKDALFLIREEIAIMKKLNHPNLVELYEVLDDPEEDSLYMVLEMCKKGVIMKVGLNDPAAPYPAETCRCWFRDLILGIEYLHAQGVVHRDIKPDNLLLTEDDVLKISDFGVSEMFDKPENMRTTKSAGSPAFLPPELCVARHGEVSGKAADIWSMGVSLYCLRYGKIPFEETGILEMYGAIRNNKVDLPEDEDPDFVDLMNRILEKDPEKRITMAELRDHPWVTKGGEDPLLSAEDNCAEPIGMPNALEVNHAFTRRISHLFCVMKAISKFKSLLTPKGVIKKPYNPQPLSDDHHKPPDDQDNRSTSEKVEDTATHAASIIHDRERFFAETRRARHTATGSSTSGGEKGHAHTLSSADVPFLGIGTGGRDDSFTPSASNADAAAKDNSDNVLVVSESPTAVDFNVYDRAFEDEVDKIKRSTSRRDKRRGDGGTRGQLYRTKHLTKAEADKFFEEGRDVAFVGEEDGEGEGGGEEGEGEKESLGEKFRMIAPRSGPKFADLVSQTVRDARRLEEGFVGAVTGSEDQGREEDGREVTRGKAEVHGDGDCLGGQS